MSNPFGRLRFMSWIAIAALLILVVTAGFTLPANYQFLLTAFIYAVILRQIWLFARSKGEVAKLNWVLVGLLIVHNPLISVYFKGTSFWILVVVETGLVLLYLELRLSPEQHKDPGEDGEATRPEPAEMTGTFPPDPNHPNAAPQRESR
jgi:hypothetical protein